MLCNPALLSLPPLADAVFELSCRFPSLQQPPNSRSAGCAAGELSLQSKLEADLARVPTLAVCAVKEQGVIVFMLESGAYSETVQGITVLSFGELHCVHFSRPLGEMLPRLCRKVIGRHRAAALASASGLRRRLVKHRRFAKRQHCSFVLAVIDLLCCNFCFLHSVRSPALTQIIIHTIHLLAEL